jgi:hypothetical protein
MRPSIYTASKPKHAPRWRELRARGYNVIATWIDYADGGAVTDWQRLWLDCAREAADANITLVYIEPGDELRGAYVEMGIAIANHRRVMVVNPSNVKFTDAVNHPLVSVFDDIELALAVIDKLTKDAEASVKADIVNRRRAA